MQTSRLTPMKFPPSRRRGDFVAMRHLPEKLQIAAGTHRPSLISAPAGYRKNTLLAWLPVEFPALSIAPIALKEDNDPARFLTALVRAPR